MNVRQQGAIGLVLSATLLLDFALSTCQSMSFLPGLCDTACLAPALGKCLQNLKHQDQESWEAASECQSSPLVVPIINELPEPIDWDDEMHCQCGCLIRQTFSLLKAHEGCSTQAAAADDEPRKAEAATDVQL